MNAREKISLFTSLVLLVLSGGGLLFLWQIGNFETRMVHNQGELMGIIVSTRDLSETNLELRSLLDEIKGKESRYLDGLVEKVEFEDQVLERLGRLPDLAPKKAEIERLSAILAETKSLVSRIATVSDTEVAGRLRESLIVNNLKMRKILDDIETYVRRHMQEETADAVLSLKLTVLVSSCSLAAVMVLVSLILWHMQKSIAVPISRLSQAIQAISRGEFQKEIRMESGDEFETLALEFNTLAKKLAHLEELRLEAVKQLVVTIRHNINNSLASLLVLAHKMRNQDGELPPEALKDLHLMEDEACRIGKVLSELTDLRSVESTEYFRGLRMIKTKPEQDQ